MRSSQMPAPVASNGKQTFCFQGSCLIRSPPVTARDISGPKAILLMGDGVEWNFRLNYMGGQAKYGSHRTDCAPELRMPLVTQNKMKLPFPFPMNRNFFILLTAVVAMPSGLRAADGPAAVPLVATNAARIQWAETIFDFDKVIGGEPVRHDYYFTNTGNAVLKINSVNTSCGCTTAGEWTREVAPGGVGKIPVQFNSGNFSGKITKTATVTCNDAATPSVMLQIKGNVWRPVEISPQLAILNVNAELVSNATAVVRIVNHAPEPLAVYAPSSSNPQFAAEVRTNTPGQLFEVVVHSVPPLNFANPNGTITLKTSATNLPVLTFSAMCVVQPAVSVNPPRVVIQEAQLTNDWTGKFTIRSGLNRPLTLTYAAVNVPGGRADLHEVEAGRVFEVAIVVPPAARDVLQPLELTLKSNFPEYETVHVPILLVNASNAFTAQGIPMTARANRFLSSPEGRRALEPKPDEYLPSDDDAEDLKDAVPPVPAPK